MQDQEKLRDIESLGEEDESLEEDDELWEADRSERGGWGNILLVQAVICAVMMLALVFFRVSDDAKYQEIAAWYRQETEREIELPTFGRATPEPIPSPEPTAAPSPPASAPMQML